MAADVRCAFLAIHRPNRKLPSNVWRNEKCEVDASSPRRCPWSPQCVARPGSGTLKAVDPKLFPFYGDLVLRPPGRNSKDGYNADTVSISEDAAHSPQGRSRDAISSRSGRSSTLLAS